MSQFPSAYTWRSIVKKSLNHFYEQQWQLRINADNDFQRFIAIHRSIQPSVIWTSAKTRPDIIHAFNAGKMLVFRHFSGDYVCKHCNSTVPDILLHLTSQCEKTQQWRRTLVASVKTHISKALGDFIGNADAETFLRAMLDSELCPAFAIEPKLSNAYLKLTMHYIHSIASK